MLTVRMVAMVAATAASCLLTLAAGLRALKDEPALVNSLVKDWIKGTMLA